MGTATYHLGEARGDFLREGTEPEALEALRACIAKHMPERRAEKIENLDDALQAFDLDGLFLLNDSREQWVSTWRGEGGQRGAGALEVVACTLAHLARPGWWAMFETEGDPWAMVFDGSRMIFAGVVPKAPAGVVLLP